MVVHNELGSAFLEPVYQEALAIELGKSNISYRKEHRLEIYYKENVLDKKYFADFLCYNQIVVELKACSGLTEQHIAQALNYITALNVNQDLLINFGTPPPAMEAGDHMKPSFVFIRAFLFVFICGI